MFLRKEEGLGPRRLSAIKQLVIQEEHEIFGDVTVHCSSLSSEVDVDAELDALPEGLGAWFL